MTKFPETAVSQTSIGDLTLLAQGKVRDVYAVDDERLAIVATDRLSAYDVVLPDPIPGKGAILTAISDFWFSATTEIVPNHRLAQTLADVSADKEAIERLSERTVIVKRLTPLPIEAVVRGYLIGSGWRDYRDTGSVCGHALPTGLPLASKLPDALFTPATKAAVGDHDENIDFETVRRLVGEDVATAVRDASLSLFQFASAHARARGLILADTKFEFGRDAAGNLFLIDEALTPDSSRYWDAREYCVGHSPASFDKQIVRDYLETCEWDKEPPGPRIPADLLRKTRQRYADAYDKLLVSA